MEKIPRDIIDLVLERTDIVEVISAHVRLKGAGRGSNLGLCPFHDEKTPSFNVSGQKKIFKCFGCGIGGDVIKFLMVLENKSFAQVVRELADRSNIEIPSEGRGAYATLLEMQRIAGDFFRKELLKSPEALEYVRSRGISEKTSLKFGIGYAPDSWDSLLVAIRREMGSVDPQLMEESGLFKPGKSQGTLYDAFRGRIMFPIKSRRGEIVAFGGRIIHEDSRGPKYLNSPESRIFDKGHLLYNLDNASSSDQDELIVVEGYMDVAALTEHGFENSVAPLGTGFTSHHAALLERESKRVILVFDGDRAGTQATLRALERMVDSGLEVRALRLPQGFDPQDFLNRSGGADFARLIDHAPPVLRFFCEEVIRENPLDQRATKKKAYVIIRDFFRSVNQVLLVGEDSNEPELIRFLGQQFRVDEKVIRKEFLPPPAAATQYEKNDVRPLNSHLDLGIKLLVWAYPNKELRELLMPHLEAEEVEEPLMNELHQLYSQGFQGQLLHRLSEMSSELSSHLSGLHWNHEDLQISKEDFWDYLKQFKIRSLQKILDHLRIEAQSCEDPMVKKNIQERRREVLAKRKYWLKLE